MVLAESPNLMGNKLQVRDLRSLQMRGCGKIWKCISLVFSGLNSYICVGRKHVIVYMS